MEKQEIKLRTFGGIISHFYKDTNIEYSPYMWHMNENRISILTLKIVILLAIQVNNRMLQAKASTIISS